MKIGVIGTGRMGNLFSQNLLRAGFELTVLDTNKAAYQNLTAMGAEPAESPMEVGQRAELIITSLPKNEIVQEVITGPRGILEGAKVGEIIIDMSTTFPLTTRWIWQEALKKGVDFLDAPISGGPTGARNATLTIMVGGEKKVFERARPVLEKLGSKIFHVGKSGAGQSLKLVNNLIYNLNRLAMAEGLSLGAKAGIDPKTMVEAIAGSTGNSFALQYLAQDILQGNFEGRESALALACKTLKLISDFSDEIGGLLLMTGLARQIYGLAKARGWGEQSPSSVIKLYEEALGIEVRTQ